VLQLAASVEAMIASGPELGQDVAALRCEELAVAETVLVAGRGFCAFAR
jgi:hypothetical protein